MAFIFSENAVINNNKKDDPEHGVKDLVEDSVWIKSEALWFQSKRA